MMTPPVKSGPRYNNFIQADKVRVIDESGENIGVMYTREAIEQAAGVGLDLVEVSPNADPPVCKFLDVGKYRYEAPQTANAARKTQKTQEIQEIGRASCRERVSQSVYITVVAVSFTNNTTKNPR